ncbi:MAG TPA: amidohydrolase family protein [Candidatus Binatia bacterium]
MTDVHVHLAALPDGGNGCYISPKMLRRPLSRFVAWKFGVDLQKPAAANQFYLDRLLGALGRSEKVARAVLLGMDGVYDSGGKLDMARTDFLVSNRYVLDTAGRYPDRFLAGVSINPQRADALEELARAAAAGAALVKVLPNAQCFDPADRKYLPFYRALARLGLPLLSHVGYEFSLAGRDQSAGDPARLRPALEEGVCVIGAHGCSQGLFFPEPHFKVALEFVRRYPRFYLDASALTLPNRARMLFLLRRHPEIQERLLFGTDYPVPVLAYPALGRGYRAAARANCFDRQALVLESLGIRCQDFSALSTLSTLPWR